ncbi:transcription elongation factor GreA [Candidatus Woesebacteria bacterium]|jgi:transcription elongation factor GreA|nr:transcription elongation factor GreA [Candidatus Woesebacteria bacterium]
MKKYYIKKEPRIPFTQDGYDKLVIEHAKLVADRPVAVENLRKSREMGDLSENGYYKASRAALSFLDARLRRATRLLKLAIIVSSHGSRSVQIGSLVKVKIGDKESEYTIVGGYESDPMNHTISHISPLGKAMIGKIAGDTVEVRAPERTISYTIVSVA